VITPTTKAGFVKYPRAISAVIWPTALFFVPCRAGHVRAVTLFAAARYLPLFTAIVIVRFRSALPEMEDDLSVGGDCLNAASER
jgi:hypothetical protein